MSKNEIIGEMKSNKESKFIICPQCKENSKIIINNYKFSFEGCKNGHIINNILINDFKTTQVVDEGKIICKICNQIIVNNSYNNIYLCLKCNQNLCESCKSMHDKTHNIINYHDKIFFCDLHYEPFNSYCLTCNKDLCSYCEFEHSVHKIISYEGIISQIPKEDENNIFIEKIECLKDNIKEIINKLVNLICSIDNCFDIYKDIINSNSENSKKNYFLLQNVNEINEFKNCFISDINKIIEEKNVFHKINYMMDLYNKFNLSNDIYYKTEKILNTNTISNINNINEISGIKDIKENTDIINDRNSDDSFINKTTEYNSDYMFISKNIQDNNYNNFDIKKIHKLLTIKNDKLIFDKIYVLKDGRIIAHNKYQYSSDVFLCFIFDLENDKCFNLNFNKINGIIKMDDGFIVVLTESELMLIDIKKQNYEIIQTIKINCHRLLKLNNDTFLGQISDYLGNKYIYKNKNLILEKEIKLNSFPKFKFYNYCSITEKEIAISYRQTSFFSNDKKYIGFLDLEKDEIIKSIEINSHKAIFDLLNNKVLIVGNDLKIFPIDIVNHSKKKGFTLPKFTSITSIICLNEKKFLVSQYHYINQFELDKDYKFILLSTIEIQNDYLYKYPNSRILIKERECYPKTLFLYG